MILKQCWNEKMNMQLEYQKWSLAAASDQQVRSNYYPYLILLLQFGFLLINYVIAINQFQVQLSSMVTYL